MEPEPANYIRNYDVMQARRRACAYAICGYGICACADICDVHVPVAADSA